jgi:hypothetical protein
VAHALIPADAYRAHPPEPPQTPTVEALEWCDMLIDRYGGGRVADVPSRIAPTVCDVRTRSEFNLCDCCGQRVRRVWWWADRLCLCRRCAEGRVRAGEVLARPPWRPGHVGEEAA